MLRALEGSIEIDYQRGFTGSGPHRDDLVIQFDGRDVRDVASRGEVRTLLLSLKIVELELLRELRNQSPLLLLDDVFSELDGARRQALTILPNLHHHHRRRRRRPALHGQLHHHPDQ